MVFKDHPRTHQAIGHRADIKRNFSIEFYYHPQCPACQKAKPIIHSLQKQNIPVKEINITSLNSIPPDIKKLPTIKIIDKTTNQTQIIEGYSPTLSSQIQNALQNLQPSKEKVEKARENLQKTGCIHCSIAHIHTVSGALNEAIRFAREGGMNHPEVIRRLAIALEEIAIMERIDLSPEAVANSPPKEQELIKELQPEIRRLRQHISNIKTYDDLVKTSQEARHLAMKFQELRLSL